MVAGPWGWAAVVLTAGAVVAFVRATGREIGAAWIGLGVVGGAGFVALGIAFRDPGDWRTYHGLLVAKAMAGAVLPLVAWERSGLRLASVKAKTRRTVVGWATLALVAVVLFAVRAYDVDPQSPYWTVVGLAAMVPLAAVLAAWSGWSGYVVIAGVLVNAASTFGWCATARWRGPLEAGGRGRTC